MIFGIAMLLVFAQNKTVTVYAAETMVEKEAVVEDLDSKTSDDVDHDAIQRKSKRAGQIGGVIGGLIAAAGVARKQKNKNKE